MKYDIWWCEWWFITLLTMELWIINCLLIWACVCVTCPCDWVCCAYVLCMCDCLFFNWPLSALTFLVWPPLVQLSFCSLVYMHILYCCCFNISLWLHSWNRGPFFKVWEYVCVCSYAYESCIHTCVCSAFVPEYFNALKNNLQCFVYITLGVCVRIRASLHVWI